MERDGGKREGEREREERSHTRSRKHTHTHSRAHAHARTHTHAHTHSSVFVFFSCSSLPFPLLVSHARARARVHTRTRTHARTHTHTLFFNTMNIKRISLKHQTPQKTCFIDVILARAEGMGAHTWEVTIYLQQNIPRDGLPWTVNPVCRPQRAILRLFCLRSFTSLSYSFLGVTQMQCQIVVSAAVQLGITEFPVC